MQNKIFIIILFLNVFFKAQKTNLAPSIPSTDEYFGITITDEYRNLENLQDPKVIDWTKSQSNYATSVLNSISNKSYYSNKRLEFDQRQGYSISDLKITSNDKYFYLKRNVDEKVAKAYFRNNFNGKEEELFDPKNFIPLKKSNNSHNNFIINLISPSWDGSKLAVSLTENGKELSEVIVIDVKTKYIYPEIITNTNPSTIGGIKWLDDNSGFFYVYYPDIDLQSAKFRKNTQSVLYRIGEDPKKINNIFSNSNNPDLKISETDYPAIVNFNTDDQHYIGILVDAEDFRRTFIINKKDLLQGKKNWQQLYDKDSKVYFIRSVGENIYFLSGYNSPNYKLCKTNITNKNFKNPEVLVPEKKDEVITQYAITKDGIYFATTKNGVEAKLYLYKDGKEISIKLPFVSGNLNLQSKGKDFSEIW